MAIGYTLVAKSKVMTKEKLLNELIREGYLKTPLIIEAFRTIDRKDFVQDAMKEYAYVNQALPIGYEQTISQPLTVAFMLELLEPKPEEKILDIGTGSGWQAALLAFIVSCQMSPDEKILGSIISIERVPEFVKTANENIAKYNFIKKGIVKIIQGDGGKGYEDYMPYDKIIAAATTPKIPSVWKSQLKIGGIIVAPVNNSIIRLEKKSANEFVKKEFFGFSFVPLIEN